MHRSAGSVPSRTTVPLRWMRPRTRRRGLRRCGDPQRSSPHGGRPLRVQRVAPGDARTAGGLTPIWLPGRLWKVPSNQPAFPCPMALSTADPVRASAGHSAAGLGIGGCAGVVPPAGGVRERGRAAGVVVHGVFRRGAGGRASHALPHAHRCCPPLLATPTLSGFIVSPESRWVRLFPGNDREGSGCTPLWCASRTSTDRPGGVTAPEDEAVRDNARLPGSAGSGGVLSTGHRPRPPPEIRCQLRWSQLRGRTLQAGGGALASHAPSEAGLRPTVPV